MKSHDHPLAGVLKNEKLNLRVSRLVIFEWLAPGNMRTGYELANCLKELGANVSYVECASKEELLANLRTLAADVLTHGNPIVHIEAHGEKATDQSAPRGFLGPGEGGPETLLSWEELGAGLRAVNLATRFNLLVVGAACYGEGLLLGVEGGLPSPFVSVVGYRGEVAEMSLRHALIQLYRHLLIDRWELSDAVDSANREHHFSTDAELRVTSAALLALESFADARHVPPSMHRGLLPVRVREAIERRAIDEGWALHFAFDAIPENKERFAINLDEFLARSAVKHEWTD